MEKGKKCVLYDNKLCDECGECEMCDLDPKKKCDSCGKCIDSGNDYNTMDVDLICDNGGMPLNYTIEGENCENEYDDDYDEEYVGEYEGDFDYLDSADSFGGDYNEYDELDDGYGEYDDDEDMSEFGDLFGDRD